MGPNKNLLAALKAEKGRDIEAEKRKKQLKSAEKQKQKKKESKAFHDSLLDGGVLLEKPADQKKSEKSDDFEDFEDDNESSSADDDIEAGDEQDARDAQSESEDDEEEEEEDGEDSDVPLSELSEEDRADTVPHQRLTINNTAALTASTNRVRIAQPKHKLSVHNSLVSSLPTNIPDPNDDLTRELEFYRICQEAAREARKILKKEDVPFSRPSDYFAEMVKSDEHMGKIKQKLYEEGARKKASQEARKQRDLKKFGKQVQVAKEQERAKEKRQTLEKINDLKRKRKGQDTGKVTETGDDLFDIGVEDNDADPSGRSKKRRRDGDSRGGDNKKPKMDRSARDKRFGFGGKKKFSKSGDAASSADMSGFSARKMKGRTGGGGSSRGGAAKRPGKTRRMARAGR